MELVSASRSKCSWKQKIAGASAAKYQAGRSLKAWLCGISLKKAWRRSRGQWLRHRLLAPLRGERPTVSAERADA